MSIPAKIIKAPPPAIAYSQLGPGASYQAILEAAPHYLGIRIRYAISGTRERTVVSGGTTTITTETFDWDVTQSFDRTSIRTGAVYSDVTGDHAFGITGRDQAGLGVPGTGECHMKLAYQLLYHPKQYRFPVISPGYPWLSIHCVGEPGGMQVVGERVVRTIIDDPPSDESVPTDITDAINNPYWEPTLWGIDAKTYWGRSGETAASVEVTDWLPSDWRDLRGEYSFEIPEPLGSWDTSDVAKTWGWEIF